MKLTKSRLLDIIQEEVVAELSLHEAGLTRDEIEAGAQEAADTLVPGLAGNAAATAGLQKYAPGFMRKYGSKLLPKALKAAAVPAVSADVAGNLAVSPIAKGMSKVRDVTGTEPVWPESWKDTIVDRLPEEPGFGDIASETAKAALGMERDIDFKRALNPLAYSADVVAAATGRVPFGGGTLTGPGSTQAEADDYYAAQAEADEISDSRDDGDVPPEDYDDTEALAREPGMPYSINPAPQNPLDLKGPAYSGPNPLRPGFPITPSEGVPYLGPSKVKRLDLAESTLARWQKIIKS